MSVRTRDRIVAAAAEMATDEGWSQLTMAKLARTAGVSRQTVYNELGSKSELAEAVVLREVAVFLGRVDDAFRDHPDNAVSAIHAAAHAVLETAPSSKLLQMILGGGNGAGDDLLPLLTTRSGASVETAAAVVTEWLQTYGLGLDDDHLQVAVDTIVRLMFSHITHPGGPADDVARDVAWVASRLLGVSA